jgi:hypothetical protein
MAWEESRSVGLGPEAIPLSGVAVMGEMGEGVAAMLAQVGNLRCQHLDLPS